MIRRSRLPLVAGLLCGLAALAAPPAAAQSPQILKTMTGARGLVVHGKGGFLGTLPGSGPFTPIAGELGRCVAVGDLDGDGLDELVAGAPSLPTSPQTQVLDEAGHVYVVFGSAAHGAPGSLPKLELDPIAAGSALNLVGDPGDHAGASVAAAGDVDGDGFGDLLIGTPNRTVGGRVAAGGAYILFGAADLSALSSDHLLSALAAGPEHRALFVAGARELGAAGTSVAGDVDVNADGFDDVVIGAPLDSTDNHSQNGTATVLYGAPNLPLLHSFDLATLAQGEGTVVYGSSDFEFLGWALAGLGRFDAVLPMTNNLTNPTLGDDVAIGAPGTASGAKVFAGAAYVLRGVAAGSHALAYFATDFGNGPQKAGVVYRGAALGDQAGSAVARIGPLSVGADGFTQLAVSAPFNDGIGKADSGSAYLVYGGMGPQGADLGALSVGAGVTVWGPTTAGGQRGVLVADAGDFDSDGLRDIALAHPNAPLIVGTSAYVGAGRLRLLDGSLLYAATGPVYLGNFSVPWSIMEFSGETAGDYAGFALASGDVNGDGDVDVAVGAPGAASDPKAQDPTGVARTETGRAHVVYGASLRLGDVTPAASWFGGPNVTIAAVGLPASIGVTVEGQPATIVALVPGLVGSLTIQPPAPPSPGVLGDIAVTSAAGDDVLVDALQYLPLAIASGPTPPEGFAGSVVAFTGQAFSTAADTSVTVGGVAATVSAIDGLAGTLSVTLPAGPPDGVPLDVVVENSNGSVSLPGAIVYGQVLLSSVSPGQGPQTSGVFDAAAVPYTGQPAIPVQVHVQFQAGPPAEGDLVIEFGTEALGYKAGVDPQIAGDTVTVSLPPFLLGPQDVTVDVRARLVSTGDAGVLPQSFTYLASDFTEHDEFASPGLGPDAPAALMAGEFTNGGQVLLLISGLKGPQALGEVLFFGTELAQPPIEVLGGLLGVSAEPQFIVLLPGGLGQIAIASDMPTDIPPSADGMSTWVQVITQESSGGTAYGFTNLLQMTIDLP